ncbi:MAG: polysaccharide biosynthesis/export family protein [Phycisphaeraceae bacterium]|nr:polysaccharide biosynthesis/export family protein [Phycisphaeraceae bacterium]
MVPGSSGGFNPLLPLPRATRLMAVCGLAAAVTGLSGCTDSFMDPSITGRWEYTPTVVPILDRIASIEDDDTSALEYSDPVAEDLLPQPASYRVTPGDALTLTLYDLIVTDRPDSYDVLVDQRGFIDVPQLGRFMVAGKTVEQIRLELEQAMTRFVSTPLVQILLLNARGETFSIVGAERPGQYTIPNSNLRLLQALTYGGRFDETVPEILVIRQVPLSDAATGMPMPETPATGTPTSPTPPTGVSPTPRTPEDLLNVIDELTGQGGASPQSPGLFATGLSAPRAAIGQPDSPPAGDGPDPVVDLVDQLPPAAPRTTTANGASNSGSWVFLNGRWVQVSQGQPQAGAAPSARPGTPPGPVQNILTQRIIRIPLQQLLAGNQSYNIVIRPGDVVRIPQNPFGFIYLSGQVARPGPIQLPASGGLTLLRALDAAGGPSAIAILDRVDLTRMIGNDRQATIRLDVKAISEQTQPDVFLKPNDRINVGTNFWALPLAIVRNGFRANYGFGILVDRNFGNDIFGPPPESVRRFE